MLVHHAILETFLAHARSPDLLGWLWESYSRTIFEEHGLDIISNAFVENRRVAVALNVNVQPLMRLAPTDLHGSNWVSIAPSVEAFKDLLDTQRVMIGDAIQEGVPKASMATQFRWDIQEVIDTVQALRMEHLNEPCSGADGRQILEQQRSTGI